MKTVKLPIYGITITNDGKGSGIITSDLKVKDRLPSVVGQKRDYEPVDGYEAAINGIESLLLAMACSGINLDSPAILLAIETTVENIRNEYL